MPLAALTPLLVRTVFLCSVVGASSVVTTHIGGNSQTSFGSPYSDKVPFQITLNATSIASHRNSLKRYCAPLTISEATFVRDKVVLTQNDLPTPCRDEVHFHYLHQAGAVGALVFDKRITPGWWQLKQLELPFPVNISTFPAITITFVTGEAIAAALSAGLNVTVAASVSSADNSFRNVCLPGPLLLFSVFFPLCHGALGALALLRWAKFVRALGLQRSLPQAVFALVFVVEVLAVLHLVPDGLLCNLSVYPAFLGQLLLTFPITMCILVTLLISFYFRGVVNARKGRSPLARYRTPLTVICVTVTLLDIVTSYLRTIGLGTFASVMTALLYVCFVLPLALFFIRSASAVLTALANSHAPASASRSASGRATPAIATATTATTTTVTGGTGAGAGGSDTATTTTTTLITAAAATLPHPASSSRPNSRSARMARWLMATAAALLLLLLVAVLFTLRLVQRSGALYYTCWTLMWVSRGAWSFTLVMMFKVPRSSVRVLSAPATSGGGVAVSRLTGRYSSHAPGGGGGGGSAYASSAQQ